ncbi:MAG TPA: Dabb family protein [Candidatus Edwardsbacteria bacterium]|nr:Dabb family protein [Candidatus Edwardsbacteria bacterium]
MVKHIVLWTFKPQADGRSKQENLAIAKQKLEAMNGKIPGLKHLEVGINYNQRQGAWDLALYSEHGTREDLEVYQNHPEHKKVVEYLGLVRDQRAVVDYEK